MTEPLKTRVARPAPGDLVVSYDEVDHSYLVYRPIREAEWVKVDRAVDLTAGDWVRCTAPDGSGVVEHAIGRSPRGTQTATPTANRMMHGTRGIESYFSHGWTVERRR